MLKRKLWSIAFVLAGALIVSHAPRGMAQAQDTVIAPSDSASVDQGNEKNNNQPDSGGQAPEGLIKTPGGTLVDPKGMEMEYGANWRHMIDIRERRNAKFFADQARRWKNAAKVSFSVRKMDDVEKSYPFLHEDFQSTRDMQKRAIDYMDKNSDHSMDISVPVAIGESVDNQTGINLLFVKKGGKFFCGAHGCRCIVYADEGAGYKKAGDYLIEDDNMYVSREGGHVSLFLSPPQENAGKVIEWILKDHQFIKNRDAWD